jgi:hypothetical protein
VPGGSVAVRRRLVAIEADLGEGREDQWRYGSGLLLADRKVLTAAHVVQGAKAVALRRPGDELSLTADLDGSLIGDPDGLDLAIVDVPEAELLDKVQVGVVNRDVVGGEFVEGCWAVGFPAFMEERDDMGRLLRETAEVEGKIPPMTGLNERLLSLQVTVRARDLPAQGTLHESEWAGMSGAPVFAGSYLLGVVDEHSPRRGPSNITVMPISRLLDREDAPSDSAEWWAGLGVRDPRQLRRLPWRPEPPYWATVREIRRWTPNLEDREDWLARIAEFATGTGDAFDLGSDFSAYLWLVADPWAGKTALLAEAVHRFAAEVDVVAYFLIARESNASRERFLAAVVPQIAWLLDEDVPAAIDIDVFRGLWGRAADRAEMLGRPLLLVVDGLDEDLRPGQQRASVASALPTMSLGDYARVLVTSRPYPKLPDDVFRHPLQSISPVPLTPSVHAVELEDLAKRELDLLLKDNGAPSTLAYQILGLLTAAAGALSADDLAEMVDNVHAWEVDAFVHEQAARSLRLADSLGETRFTFAHETLRKLCQQHPRVGDAPAYRARLYDWADRWQAKCWPVSDEAAADTPRYLLDSYPASLSGDLGRLAQLVSDIGWLDAAVVRLGVEPVLATLREAARSSTTNRTSASILRLLQLQANCLRSGYQEPRGGRAATQIAWEALRAADGHRRRCGQATAMLARASAHPSLDNREDKPVVDSHDCRTLRRVASRGGDRRRKDRLRRWGRDAARVGSWSRAGS